MKGQKQIFSTGKDDWGTPPALIEALQTRFCRKFGLDVAASKENKICEEFYSEEDNALTKFWGWSGTAWCNPPYSQCAEFVHEGQCQAKRGAIVFMLIPARTDTVYWHECILGDCNADIYFIRGRIKFVGAKSGAPFPSAIIHFAARNKHEFFQLELTPKERGF